MKVFTDVYNNLLTKKDSTVDGENLDVLDHFFWGIRNGISIELGALDGSDKTFSMTCDLEKYFGWRRILIEGNPKYRPDLLERSPSALSVNAAICEEEKIIHYGLRSYVGGIVEYMDPKFVNIFYPELPKTKTGSIDWSKAKRLEIIKDDIIEVPCVRLEKVLIPLGVTRVNFFILDVEGNELNVLKAIDWSTISFDVICVETDPSLRPNGYRDAVTKYLHEKGYEDFSGQQGRNTWYKQKDFLPYPSPYSVHKQYKGTKQV